MQFSVTNARFVPYLNNQSWSLLLFMYLYQLLNCSLYVYTIIEIGKFIFYYKSQCLVIYTAHFGKFEWLKWLGLFKPNELFLTEPVISIWMVEMKAYITNYCVNNRFNWLKP